MSRREGNANASAMVFDLFSNIIARRTAKTLQYSAKLYSINS